MGEIANQRFTIRNDIVFKAVFGRDNSDCKQMLTNLLNAILDLKDSHKIYKITYKNPFNLQQLPVDKLSVMDIKIETEKNELIDVEIQVGNKRYFEKRSLFYWANLYMESITESERYNKLKKCIVINIVDFKCFNSNNYHRVFKIVDRDENILLTDDLEIHFIELPIFDDKKTVEEMTEIEQWVTFLKDSDKEDKSLIIKEIIERKAEVKMAADYVNKINQDEQIREQLLAIEKYRLDHNTNIDLAREEGREEGIKEGAYKKMIEIAQGLLELLDDETIAKKTGLTIEEIRAIRCRSKKI